MYGMARPTAPGAIGLLATGGRGTGQMQIAVLAWQEQPQCRRIG
jgi:hypothetical protein